MEAGRGAKAVVGWGAERRTVNRRTIVVLLVKHGSKMPGTVDRKKIYIVFSREREVVLHRAGKSCLCLFLSATDMSNNVTWRDTVTLGVTVFGNEAE